MKTSTLFRCVVPSLLLGSLSVSASAQMAKPKPMMGPPPPPATAAMQGVLDQLKSYDAPPLQTLTPGNARNAPSVQGSAQEVLSKKGKPVFAPIGDISHRTIPGYRGAQTLVRFYRPLNAPSGPLPLLVYYHGGGFVIANLDVYDGSCRALANGAKCIVASVAYPLSPEHPFPAAPETCYAVTQHLMKYASYIGADPRRVAVAGESAGGNLATVMCMMAKARHGMMPIHQLLVYPYVLNSTRLSNATLDREFPSYASNANAVPLGKAVGKWFWPKYVPKRYVKNQQYAEPIVATTSQLRGLPPATIIGAQIDALESEGQRYRDMLSRAGVPVQYRLYTGVTHEFFGLGSLVPQAKQAEDFACQQLKTAFSK